MERRKRVIIELVFDSSSSSNTNSDSDDSDCVENRKKNKRPRVENFIETVICRYSAVEFKQNFRMSRTTFQYLLLLLRPHLEGKRIGRNSLEPEKQLYIALYVLGTPDSYRLVTTKFDTGKGSAWRAVNRVVKALCYLRNYFIRWPTEEESTESFRWVKERYGFPKVLGSLDGTQIHISAPKKDRQSYVNRKGFYAIQLQVICNYRREFIHCYTGLPGSVHDARVFKYSGVQDKCSLDFFPDNSHLLADSAYTLQNHIMVPFTDNGHLTNEEIKFNRTLSSARMMVERSFGLLKKRWRCLLDKLPMTKTKLVPYYILACCVLHNVCLKNRDTFEYPITISDDIVEYPDRVDVDQVQRDQGVQKRLEIEDFINS